MNTTETAAIPGLKVTCQDGVAVVTLDRPSRRNALDDELEAALRATLHRQAQDPQVRVIVLTGAGGSFCAGKDLRSAPAGAAPAEVSGRIEEHRFAFLTRIPKPVIALVDGAAAGIGLMLALYCDLRIASTRALFTTAFSRRGLIAEHGSAWLLPRMVGLGHAADLLLTARPVSACDALRMGLVNQVVEPETLEATGWLLAKEMAQQISPRSMREIKRQLWRDLETRFDEALRLAEADQGACLDSEDAREGLLAFKQRRTPRFSGA